MARDKSVHASTKEILNESRGSSRETLSSGDSISVRKDEEAVTVHRDVAKDLNSSEKPCPNTVRIFYTNTFVSGDTSERSPGTGQTIQQTRKIWSRGRKWVVGYRVSRQHLDQAI